MRSGYSSAGMCLALSLFAHATPVPGRGACVILRDGYSTCGRLFVIAVGVNTYPQPFAALRQAEADAGRLSRRLICEWARPGYDPVSDCPNDTVRDTSDRSRVKQWLLTGASATRDGISQAFAAVQREAGPGDLFVFYFAGKSGWVDVAGHRVTVLLPADIQLPPPGANAPWSAYRNVIDLRQLKLWLDNIQARRQLLVLDSGGLEELAWEMQRVLNEMNPLAARLNPRERVLLFNRGAGKETPEGGLLTYMLTHLRTPVLAPLFQARGVAQLDYQLIRLQIGDSLIQQHFPLEERLFELTTERDILRRLQIGADSATGSRGSLASDSPPGPAGTVRLRNFALLVGTNRYDATEGWRDLSNPVPDVAALNDELRTRYGFETRVLLDPTKDSLLSAILAIKRARFDSLDQVLIFVAGHGHYDDEQDLGFLVLRDGKPRRLDPFGQSYLPHNQLASFTNNLDARHVLVMLDVCFGGTFAGLGGARSDESDYQDADVSQLILRKAQYKTRQYITSGGKEYVPDGRPGRHSPFAARLLQTLRDLKPGEALTLNRLRSRLESVIPGPRAGGFGDDEPGSDFIFVARK